MSKLTRGRSQSKYGATGQWWRPSLLLVLLVIVAVPLAVAGRMLALDLDAASADRAVASEFVPGAELRLAVIRLGSALMDERAWSIGSIGTSRLDVPTNPGIAMMTSSINGKRASAKAQTDIQIAALPQFQDQLAAVRSVNQEIVVVNSAYAGLMADVATYGEEVAQNLQTLAMSRPDSAELLLKLSQVEAIADAQLAGQGLFAAYLPSQMSKDPIEFYRLLIEQREAYNSANIEIDRILGDGDLAQKVTTIRSSTPEQTLLAVSDAKIMGILDPDATMAANGVSVEQLKDIAEFVTSAGASRDQWVAAIDSVGEDMISEAELLEQASISDINSDRRTAIATTSLAVLLASAGAMLVLRSVRHLARSARALRDGDTEKIRPSGPLEIYEAGAAIGEASANIDLVRRQAAALASGDLVHPDLRHVVPGKLGADLKITIDTLMGSIRQREDAQSKAEWEATHDGLTELPNRTAALDLVRSVQSKRSDRAESAVLFVDLDNFKAVNDTFGHAYGDEVLIEIAHRLQLNSRAVDVACRMGGDEFLVVMAGMVTEAQARQAARRFISAIREAVVLSSGERVIVGASIGIAMTAADLSEAEILHNADIALHEVKENGNSILTCTPALLESVREISDIASEVRAGLDDDQFRLEYQPIVDPDGFPVALESLIRWDHPTRGLVMPDRFIPVAERTDLILAVDRWVLETAISQMALWDQAEPYMDNISVAINVSGQHLGSADIFDDILGPIERHGVDPSRLLIEITETSMMGNIDQTRTVIERLRAEGLRIAIDDFGTGYSGIAELRCLPVDLVKVDQTYIRHITDRDRHEPTLIQMIVDMAREFGAKTTAEGIETPEQAATARAMGFDALQGWLFSRSTRPEDIPNQLALLTQAANDQATAPGAINGAGY